MTLQERLDSGYIYHFMPKTLREGCKKEIYNDYLFMKEYLDRLDYKKIAILKDKEQDKHYYIYLFTNKYYYTIHISPNYIGASYSCLYQKPFEDWTRGNDLPDGKCTEEKFKDIMFAILNNELVNYDDGSEVPKLVKGEYNTLTDFDKISR